MIEGRLYYRSDLGRYGLMSNGEWAVEGFHCGNLLEVWIDGRWIPTRIEMTADEQWYLVDLPGMVLYDLKARVE